MVLAGVNLYCFVLGPYLVILRSYSWLSQCSGDHIKMGSWGLNLICDMQDKRLSDCPIVSAPQNHTLVVVHTQSGCRACWGLLFIHMLLKDHILATIFICLFFVPVRVFAAITGFQVARNCLQHRVETGLFGSYSIIWWYQEWNLPFLCEGGNFWTSLESFIYLFC